VSIVQLVSNNWSVHRSVNASVCHRSICYSVSFGRTVILSVIRSASGSVSVGQIVIRYVFILVSDSVCHSVVLLFGFIRSFSDFVCHSVFLVIRSVFISVSDSSVAWLKHSSRETDSKTCFCVT